MSLEKIRIGVVAPSSKVPQVELRLGMRRIQKAGFLVDVHPHVKKEHLFFAGNDEERANAFYEYAADSEHAVLWCARGGSGIHRVLPLLHRLTLERGRPARKLLVSYSDGTALMEFVRKQWGWATLHGPMPSLRKFSLLESKEWDPLIQWIQGNSAKAAWDGQILKFLTSPPHKEVQASLVGGNLTVWNAFVGTPFQGNAKDALLFLEDVDEAHYRIDRMMQQQILSGSLDRVRGIVLGNFLNCRDHAPSILKKEPTARILTRVLTSPKPQELRPLRKTMKEIDGMKRIFSEVGNQLKIPVAWGLPVGHGPEVSPLPIGATYRLGVQGKFELLHWDWVKV